MEAGDGDAKIGPAAPLKPTTRTQWGRSDASCSAKLRRNCNSSITWVASHRREPPRDIFPQPPPELEPDPLVSLVSDAGLNLRNGSSVNPDASSKAETRHTLQSPQTAATLQVKRPVTHGRPPRHGDISPEARLIL